jgi:hypothetical protein
MLLFVAFLLTINIIKLKYPLLLSQSFLNFAVISSMTANLEVISTSLDRTFHGLSFKKKFDEIR